MGVFDQMLTTLVNMDFFQVLFPFLLALAIFYGVLMWALGEKLKKGPVGLISIVMAFFVMLFAKQIPGLAWFLTLGSGTILAIASVVIFIIVILALLGIKFSDIWTGDKKNWTLIIIVIIVIYIVLASVVGYIPGVSLYLPWFLNYQDIWTIVIFVIILALVLHFLTREGGAAKPAENAGGRPPAAGNR
jgi:hypothetical protein